MSIKYYPDDPQSSALEVAIILGVGKKLLETRDDQNR